MAKQDLLKYYDKFIDAARLHEEATKTGDSKTANRQYTILKRIFVKAGKDIEGAAVFYKELRNNLEASVQLWACAHSLALGLGVMEAENILGVLSHNQNIGILRLDSEMTLKVWKKQGYLRF